MSGKVATRRALKIEIKVEMKRERLSAKTQRVPMEIEGDSQGVMKIFDLGDLGDLGGSMEMI